MESVNLLAAFILVGVTLAEVNFKACLNDTTYGYAYPRFFPIEMVAEDPNPRGRTYFEVYVRASRDAHILLSEQKSDTPGCEIVLGGGNNTFSQIRFNPGQRKSVLQTRKTTDVVSSGETRGFWLELTAYPRILRIGRVGNEDPLFALGIPRTFDVNYVSFSTWSNVMGEWFFACWRKVAPEGESDRNLTAAQRLRLDLFKSYRPTNYPEREGEETNRTVQVHMEASHFRLDEKRGELLLTGVAVLKWKDPRLTWDPDTYDGITSIHVTPQQVWTPNVQVLNSATFLPKSLLFRKGGLAMVKDGNLTWRVPFRSVTACAFGRGNWPRDDHNCTLEFGFLTEPFAVDVTEMSTSRLPTSQWTVRRDADADRADVVRLRFQRRDSSLIGVFPLPFFSCAGVLSLLSFWLYPNTPAKLFLSCGSVSILVVTLVGLGDALPARVAPAAEIVRLYVWSIHLTCFPVLLFIGLNYLPSAINPPRFVTQLLNSSVTETALCLPDKREVQGEIGTEREKCSRANAVRLAVLIERFAFLCYFAALVVPLWLIISLR